MKRIFAVLAYCLIVAFLISGCDERESSDQKQAKQQEKILLEATSSVGMPAIKNFRERRLLKDILEMRDQDGLTTYTYLFAENTGKLIFIGESVGFGIPCSTQFTNPQKFDQAYVEQGGSSRSWVSGVIAQADPNGLFSPASAEGTWVMLVDPKTKEARPVYIEPRIIVSPFPLDTGK